VSWEKIILESAESDADLQPVMNRLFAHVGETWPDWRAGAEALAAVTVKALHNGPDRVLVQTNPQRRRSVFARTDPGAIAARPCFLCPDHLPEGEAGIAWRDLVLLPNPYPIVERHLTIPSLRHQPQALRGRADDLVCLARALDANMVVFYNGPRGGASAPDHFHFQAGTAPLPAFEQLARRGPGPDRHPVSSFGRNFIALFDDDPHRLAHGIENAISAWGRVARHDGEPMCNVLVHWDPAGGTALFFPRRAHRPTAYFAEGAARIGVSPAAVEMGGILVVTDSDSFERLDAAATRTVFEEVSATPQEFAAFLEQLP